MREHNTKPNIKTITYVTLHYDYYFNNYNDYYNFVNKTQIQLYIDTLSTVFIIICKTNTQQIIITL